MPEQHDWGRAFAEQGFGVVDGFDAHTGDDGIVLSGRCPGCRAEIETRFTRGTPQGTKGPFRRGPASPPPPQKVTMFCECGFPHEGRPPEALEDGCGAYWSVTL